MSVDTDAIQQIKLLRAFTDPVIPHERTANWLSFHNTESNDKAIKQARLEQITNTPSDEPIPKVTWTETTLFLSTLSGDGRFVTGDAGKQTVQFMYRSFSEMLRERGVENPEHIIPTTTFGNNRAENNSPTNISDDAEEKLDLLRRELKTTQTAIFLETTFDTLPIDTSSVPKTFWKDAAMRISGSADSQTDDNTDAQAGLDMF